MLNDQISERCKQGLALLERAAREHEELEVWGGWRAVGYDFACRQAHLGRVQAYETPDSIHLALQYLGIDAGNKNQRSDARDGSVHRVKFVDLLRQVLDEVPDVGHHFRSTHDAEVDRVPVAEERDIEPHTVGDDGRQR